MKELWEGFVISRGPLNSIYLAGDIDRLGKQFSKKRNAWYLIGQNFGGQNYRCQFEISAVLSTEKNFMNFFLYFGGTIVLWQNFAQVSLSYLKIHPGNKQVTWIESGWDDIDSDLWQGVHQGTVFAVIYAVLCWLNEFDRFGPIFAKEPFSSV